MHEHARRSRGIEASLDVDLARLLKTCQKSRYGENAHTLSFHGQDEIFVSLEVVIAADEEGSESDERRFENGVVSRVAAQVKSTR